MKFSDYLKLAGMNWSRLKHMRTSPADYIWHAENGTADSDDLALGRTTHTLLFEPEQFDVDYAVWHGRRQGKDWDSFEATHAAKTIITGKDYGRALAHVVEERGFDNAEELLQSPPQRANLIRRRLKVALEIAGECAAELRLPDLPSEREQAEVDARDRAERRFEERRGEGLST